MFKVKLKRDFVFSSWYHGTLSFTLHFESGTNWVPPKFLWILIHFSRKLYIILKRNSIFYSSNISVDCMSIWNSLISVSKKSAVRVVTLDIAEVFDVPFTLMLTAAFTSQTCCVCAPHYRTNIHNLNVAVFLENSNVRFRDFVTFTQKNFPPTDRILSKLCVWDFELQFYNILVFYLNPFSAYNFLNENRVKFHALPLEPVYFHSILGNYCSALGDHIFFNLAGWRRAL